MLLFALQIKNLLMVSFIPFPILMALHIISYRAINHSQQQFNLDERRVQTMKKIRKTFFTVVCVFTLLTAPTVTYYMIVTYILKFKNLIFLKNETLIFQLNRFFTLLLSCSNCVNPFIYAKIHRRLQRCLQPNQQTTTIARSVQRTQATDIQISGEVNHAIELQCPA